MGTCLSVSPSVLVQEMRRPNKPIGDSVKDQEGAFIMNVTLVNNHDVRLWVLPRYTMKELDLRIVEVVGKQQGIYDRQEKKMVRARINAFLGNRTAVVDWDVTVGEMETNYLVYDHHVRSLSTGPVVSNIYVHTKERIKNYDKKNNMFDEKPEVFKIHGIAYYSGSTYMY